MALKIKGSYSLNSSKTNRDSDNEVFVNFMDKIVHSWKVKKVELDEVIEYWKSLDKDKYKISYTPDLLKQKSMITYIDAPWGSGKTYFVENFIGWLYDNNKKFDLGKGETKLDVDLIDAWEIYNGKSINEILFSIFKIDLYDEDFKNKVNEKAKEISKLNKDDKYLIEARDRFNRHANIVGAAQMFIPAPPIIPLLVKGVKKINNVVTDKKIQALKTVEENFKNYFNGNEYSQMTQNYALSEVLVDTLNQRFKKNEKLIIIDNIERLSTENRLDVINKIINWSNIEGVTYIFLTNFDRIKLTKVFEEDFWNKISLHETFELTNSWEAYLSGYQSKTQKIRFDDPKLKPLVEFILEIIPTFFSGNKDNMDIREIKKLLDNWKFEGVTDFDDASQLIISFISEMIEYNLIGLDKYFFINRVVSILCENKELWKLWKNEFVDEVYLSDEDKYKEDSDKKKNDGIYNNKMLRIQSNFCNLTLIMKNDEIIINEKSLHLGSEERRTFMEFNNFIDETATNKFKNLIDEISMTRKITDKENYIWRYMELTKQKEIDYFEFKYNSIEKLFIYNKIIKFKSK